MPEDSFLVLRTLNMSKEKYCREIVQGGARIHTRSRRMRLRYLLTAAVFVLLLFCMPPAASLADSGDPLALEDSYPANGAVDVPVDVTCVLTFNKNVADISVRQHNKGAITAVDKDGVDVPLNVEMKDMPSNMRRKITITFQEKLDEGSRYTLIIGPKLTAKNGQETGVSEQITFTTKKTTDPKDQEKDEDVDTDKPPQSDQNQGGSQGTYNDDGKNDDSNDSTQVVMKDGGKGSGLYSGNEGDKDRSGSGDRGKQNSGRAGSGNGSGDSGSGSGSGGFGSGSGSGGRIASASGSASSSGAAAVNQSSGSVEDRQNTNQNQDSQNDRFSHQLTAAHQQLPQFAPHRENHI